MSRRALIRIPFILLVLALPLIGWLKNTAGIRNYKAMPAMQHVIYNAGSDLQGDDGLKEAAKKESADTKSYDLTFTVER